MFDKKLFDGPGLSRYFSKASGLAAPSWRDMDDESERLPAMKVTIINKCHVDDNHKDLDGDVG